ncbi:MAG: hypothetical protein QOJ05_1777 [Verrucomicrobiota bacterium]
MTVIASIIGQLTCCGPVLLFFGAVTAAIVYLQLNAAVPGGIARGKKMRAAAAELGWSYVDKVSFQSMPGVPSLHLFTHGTSHRVAHLLAGVHDGTQMSLFDHGFKRPFHKAYFIHTVVMASSGSVVGLPTFVLRATRFFQNLGETPSNQITFPNHPKFSSQFVLLGTDESAVRRVFSDAVIEYCEMHPGLCLENTNGLLVVFRQAVLAPPQRLAFYLDEVNTLLRLFASGLSGVPMPPPHLPPPLP